MSNDTTFLEATDWLDTSQCPPSVGGATFLIVAYSAVIAIGLLGNAGLVFIITRQQELRNVTNILIANLSCSDILMCVVCLPVTVIYTLMDHWVLGEALCKVTPFVQCMSVTVSIFSLVLIALERHQLILHPTGWTPAAGHSYLAVGLTWLVGCFISLPFLSFNILTNDPFQNISLPSNPFRDHLICMELWPSDKHRLAYTTSLLIFQYCLPLLLVLLCYLRIFIRLRRRRSHSYTLPHALQKSSHHRDMLERSRRTRGAQRINVMLLAIVIAFALCWLPLNVFNTLFDWHHQALPKCQHDAVFSACHLTAMASTCINPVVYGFLNSNFQRELRTTLQRCQCGTRAGESYESFPLSTVGSEGITKATSLNRMGSVCVPSPRPEISSALLSKTLPANL
ncbi:neuropeptide Y receptor type 1-like isoform X1 [Xiphophorus maculatus]|uniref:neuropeptide Y receptor Y8a isoform X1 n=1 Tax=Poecilia latipinna TaxID=48699 RepID=UPI00072E5F58|nr:PREDICTED: neuropeptide Y receptor type 1-like isoform X1 [Poecilia latipinna]XP_014887290.1 PREDICTED: neuropeptide Y receptor type 1-like isoform X1 [Poecilia latipinna]XP_014887291.1 PREDICTED: neuropeptide Y receptor type 1-like isoform X1 [Poecilia latipinna]XP_014887292.1 PREDICTED: neuropeptide Y receptor type 1-like isoform X1 [Poecilia latipinna]XP_023194590.1 neuropeptide Y receptor type 1-like isoform X1 [Xiphophorus maculatus]XP_023194591.1 neuropeptide Y receptor type 1-like is